MGYTFRFLRREVWMPWMESSVTEERLRFVARLLDGEAMTDVCRDFGISRKTGYKIFDRYTQHGLEALSDRSRRPVRYANQLPQPTTTQPNTTGTQRDAEGVCVLRGGEAARRRLPI
jgi:transposase-like protein